MWPKRLLADVIKDFEMMRLPLIIQVGTKCNQIYPYKRKIEGYFTIPRGVNSMKTEQRERDLKLLALKIGAMKPHVKEGRWTPEAGRKWNLFLGSLFCDSRQINLSKF